ncbi:MAG: M48 family metallopeptidase [Verrucomicrobiales bacterium]
MTWYDGRSPIGRGAMIEVDPQTAALRVMSAEDGCLLAEHPRSALRLEAPMGDDGWLLRLPGGEVCECPPEHDEALVRLLRPGAGARFSRRAERSLRIALVCLVAAAALVAGFFRFGVPVIASLAAERIPLEMEERLSSEAMRVLDDWVFEPSEMSAGEQAGIREEFAELAAGFPDAPPYRIEFRRSRVGPNAFALPAGLIIMTDELVELAEDRRQVHGVLAHELGHIHHRHGMRGLLQTAGNTVVFTVFLGDVSSSLALAGALPAMLIETGHSRRFEREADAYATEFALRTGLGEEALIGMLELLAREYGDGSELAWISTHPPTPERAELIRRAAPPPTRGDAR